ncbi:MAG: hypothetical protein LQ339_008619 [Xanthoria mediterranea]|nr:MAG: hypothetical protein LQ339_008619 [Xanthoria mediterranea]
MAKRVITRANCLVFFGADLSQNDEFNVAALEFPQAVVFAAEVLRITPRYLMPGRRKAIEPFRFSDGLLVRTGDWVCLPQQAMMKDEQLHPRPACFDPTRFLNRQRLQDLWPVWGLGTATCEPTKFWDIIAEGPHPKGSMATTYPRKVSRAKVSIAGIRE